MHGFGSVESTWYNADGQSVGVTMVMAEVIVVSASGDGSGKLAVWDALELAQSEAIRDLVTAAVFWSGIWSWVSRWLRVPCNSVPRRFMGMPSTYRCSL